jgi:hypothetical protein
MSEPPTGRHTHGCLTSGLLQSHSFLLVSFLLDSFLLVSFLLLLYRNYGWLFTQRVILEPKTAAPAMLVGTAITFRATRLSRSIGLRKV